jgi:hypothetical protein
MNLLLYLVIAVEQILPFPSPFPVATSNACAFSKAATKANSTNSSFTISYTPGAHPSVICVGVDFESNTPTVSSVGDGTNGSYTSIGSSATLGLDALRVYCVQNTASGALTISITASATVQAAFNVMEFSGCLASGAFSSISESSGTLNTSGAHDINTSGNVTGNSNDAIVTFTSMYYGPNPAFTVGATNPSGAAIPANATYPGGSGNNNITASYSILSGAYTGKVGNGPGASSANTYGNTIGFQIKAN